MRILVTGFTSHLKNSIVTPLQSWFSICCKRFSALVQFIMVVVFLKVKDVFNSVLQNSIQVRAAGMKHILKTEIL